jgi:uncharacterized membrane protein
MESQNECRVASCGRTGGSRFFALDALRGLIIVLMALDHANYFVAQKHSPGEYWGGPFPVYPDALAFLTRFVTHLAAPGFLFLMGVGMVLFVCSRERHGWSRWKVLGHFLIRGGFLIALQLLVVNRVWELSPERWEVSVYIGVLFALGGCMILGGPLVWLRPAHLLALTALLFVGTELIHPSPDLWGMVSNDPANLLLARPGGDRNLWSNYPVLPWLELVTLGMVFGHWLVEDPRRAFSQAWKLGLAFLLAFLVVRLLDGFGNIRPRPGDSWIELLNAVKYPPSMAFSLLTMGVNLLLLWLFTRTGEKLQRFLRPLVVFGQVPLFFYILHLFLYAIMGRLLTPQGSSIAAMIPLRLLGLVALYPLCLGYGRFKQRQSPGSLIRFL